MRKEQFSIGELTVGNVIGGIEPFVRRRIFLDAVDGSDGNDGLAFTRAKRSLAAAKAAVTSDKRDRIYLIGKSASRISLTADPAFSLNSLDLIGLDSGCMYGGRARIGMSTDYGTPAITFSGANCRVSNIDFMHLDSLATHVSHVAFLLSGTRNAFLGCHFNSPNIAAMATDTSFVGLEISGSENYFNHCIFGARNVARTGSNPNVLIDVGTGDQVFEDCIFQVEAGDTTPLFVKIDNTQGTGLAIFKRCLFIGYSTNWAVTPAVAFAVTSSATCGFILMPDCQFVNVTKVASAGDGGFVKVPAAAQTPTSDVNALIALPGTF